MGVSCPRGCPSVRFASTGVAFAVGWRDVPGPTGGTQFRHADKTAKIARLFFAFFFAFFSFFFPIFFQLFFWLSFDGASPGRQPRPATPEIPAPSPRPWRIKSKSGGWKVNKKRGTQATKYSREKLRRRFLILQGCGVLGLLMCDYIRQKI